MHSSALRIELLFAAALLAVAPTPREIDVAQSTATFSVQHIWVENVTGTVPILRGTVTLSPDSLIPEAATAVVDAARIATGEPDRDRSLASPDFFDAAQYPHWTFASTKIVAKGSNAFEMDGDLTIHGVTQPEVLNVTASGSPDHPHYHAIGQIDRHAFGMIRTRLDPTIGSTVTVTLDVVLK
jgi:polyisoprenoid-binding protein YceI